MTLRSVGGHILILIATIAGIIGFGLIYDGITAHRLILVTTGIPLLMVGLWWAGRELGRSMTAAKSRRSSAADN